MDNSKTYCEHCGVVEIPEAATIPYCHDCFEQAYAEGRVRIVSACLSEDGCAEVYVDGRQV